jgi:hypothetical protein
MASKNGLGILAAAVALALSAGAHAGTTSQTIILNIVDTTNGNQFTFDTALPTSTTDPGHQSFNLASNAAYQQFIAGENSSADALSYSVVGYTTDNTVDTTSQATPTVKAGSKSAEATINVSQFLVGVNNPAGGATYLPAASLSSQQSNSWALIDVAFTGNIGGVDLSAVGTPENFYAITTSNASGTRSGAAVAQLASSWDLTSSGLLTYGPSGPTPDTYVPSTKTLTIPTLAIGGATFSDVVLTSPGIVTPPSGTGPNGSEDSYDPASNRLTVQAVTLGTNTLYNVVITPGTLVSIGSVTNADTYNAGQLTIPAVSAFGNTYTNVVITVKQIVSIGSGLPHSAVDQYDGTSHQLTVAAAAAFGRVFTNVVVTVGSIVSINGHAAAAERLETIDPDLQSLVWDRLQRPEKR